RLAVAGEYRVPVLASLRQHSQGTQRVVHAVLRSHHACVADQVRLSTLERRIWLACEKAAEIGAIADDEYLSGQLRASGLRDLAIGLVGRQHDVGDRVAKSLHRERQSMQE